MSSIWGAARDGDCARLRALLQNPEVLSINQDARGLQGRRLRSRQAGRSTLELWTDTLCAHLRWKVAPESLPSEAW